MLNKLSNINKQSFSVIKILIVEDDRKIRDSYVQLINDTEDMVCVGSYESCEKMFKEIDHLGVDVILMDIGLPGMNGIEGIKKVKELYPSIEILMMTVYDDDEKIF
jgi:DNA-binding NarL/FixJ family response regulator